MSPDRIDSEIRGLNGRPGHAERSVMLTRVGEDFSIQLDGWYTTTVDLNPRQIAFLRDTLNRWFPCE